MPDIPTEAYEAAARAWAKYVHAELKVADERTVEVNARRLVEHAGLHAVVDAVWPLAVTEGRRQAAEAIRAHTEKHAPVDGNEHQRRLRRHLNIAERVANPLTEDEIREGVVELLNGMAERRAARIAEGKEGVDCAGCGRPNSPVSGPGEDWETVCECGRAIAPDASAMGRRGP